MSDIKNNKLGRGLEALLGDTSLLEQVNKSVDSKMGVEEKAGVIEFDINQINPDPDQPRKKFDAESLKELADSIRENGVLQPILIRRKSLQQNVYHIISGERRYRAVKSLGLAKIPAIVKDISNEQALEIAIVENLQRDDLNPVEEARAYKNLIDNFGYTQDHLAKKVGKSRSYLTNCLRILNLSKNVLDMVADGKISLGHAKTLVGMENSDSVANDIVSKNLSVRDVEKLSKGKKVEPKKIEKITKNESHKGFENTNLPAEIAKEVESLKDILSYSIGMDVNILTDGRSGKIEINFKNFGELNNLMSAFNRLEADKFEAPKN